MTTVVFGAIAALMRIRPSLASEIVRIVEQHALIGHQRPARRASLFGQSGKTQIEFGICRLFQDALIEGIQFVRTERARTGYHERDRD